MKQTRKLIKLGIFALILFFYAKCQNRGKFTGFEYMPDMAHSVAYESNLSTFYKFNHFGSRAEYEKMVQPHLPPAGTIARGMSSYPYPNTDEGRAQAMQNILSSPFGSNRASFDKGKQLYLTYCGVCHGEKADGNGILYNGGEGPYKLKPANLLDSQFVNATDGRIYHAIMFGKNSMQGYKDKMNAEERWNVINYIRYLQDKDKVKSNVDKDFDALYAAPKVDSTGKTPAVASNSGIITLNNLYFISGSTSLKGTSYIELDKLVAALKKYTNVKIQVNGHTDSDVSKAMDNMTLSRLRAQEVVDYLVANGISASRLSAQGFGDTKPVAANGSAAGKQQNRRVELQILSK